MAHPIYSLFNRLVTKGELTIVQANGRAHRFGPGGAPRVRMRVVDKLLEWKLLLSPDVEFGEAYVNGGFVLEEGDISDLLFLCTGNLDALENYSLRWMQMASRMFKRMMAGRNSREAARHNVSAHYDLSHELYRRFLDKDLQYSCAYFPRGDETLEEAQTKKKEHIARKLLLKPGQRVLDIGCGWGGMGLYLNRAHQADVLGVTLSTEQLDMAQKRALDEGAERIEFRLQDYREVRGTFDRIVSVGMFEHVGVANYPEFFQTAKKLLAPDGVMLLHAIGRMEPPSGTNPWIRKYIFPGGYCPALSEVFRVIERTGLWVTDVEILRLHYAYTLNHWYRRFQAHRSEVGALYDERFCRIWEFYLAACEMLFLNGRQMVFQIQLSHAKDAVPITRDYLAGA